MRLFALLLLAAAAGFAVGRLTARERGGRGGERSPIRDREVAALPADRPGQAEPPAVDTEAAPAPYADDCVRPSSRPVEEGYDGGAVEIDFNGFEGERTVWLGWFEVNGGFEETEEMEREGGIATFLDLRPGLYQLRWLDSEGRRVGTRVQVDEGKVTAVRAVDHRDPAPVPRGLGVLNLHVEAAEGGGLSAEVNVGPVSFWTDDAGNASTALLPGRYRVTVGHHRSEAVVEEGRTASHRVAHGREGDLVLLADHELRLSVEPVERDSVPGWTGRVGIVGTETVVPYLVEGEYDVFLPLSFGVPLARVTIHAGRATRLRCEQPRGGVIVKLAPGPSRIDISISRVEAEDSLGAVAWNLPPDDEPIRLQPGRYRLWVSATGFEPRSAEVEVSDRVIEFALELPRLR